MSSTKGSGSSPVFAMMRYRYWVYIATGLFLVGIAVGLIVNATMPAGIVGLFSEQLSALGELGEIYSSFQPMTAVFIYFKNASVLVLSFIFGPVLCLLPVLVLVFNGSLISFVSAMVTQQESLGVLLTALLPHGIFEIPAIIIGEAAALSFGVAVMAAFFSGGEGVPLLPHFKKNLRYLLLAFILLVPAAIIETFVTPLFLQ